MSYEEFLAWARAHGWQMDRYGHLRKGDYRFKLSRVAVRMEAKAGAAGWVRLRSGYYSRLSLTPDGKLRGMHI